MLPKHKADCAAGQAAPFILLDMGTVRLKAVQLGMSEAECAGIIRFLSSCAIAPDQDAGSALPSATCAMPAVAEKVAAQSRKLATLRYDHVAHSLSLARIARRVQIMAVALCGLLIAGAGAGAMLLSR